MGLIKHGAGTVIGSSETPPPETNPKPTEEEKKKDEAETEVMEPPQGDIAED